MNNNPKEESQTKPNKGQKIVDSRKTQSNLKSQLAIIKKVVRSISWLHKKQFTDCIIYEISKFVFKNPLCFLAPVYKHVDSNRLKIDSKKNYILVDTHSKRQQEIILVPQSEYPIIDNSNLTSFRKKNDINFECRQLESFKSEQYAINIRVQRFWKGCKINYVNSTLREIITKSKHFIDFLKNVKIDHPKNQPEAFDKYNETSNSEDQQAKQYTLVCQNYDYIYNKICQVQQNQKLKKLDHSIAKTYVEMMNKNIIILTVEKNNFNPISCKSDGKYIYIENSLKLPLFSQKFNRMYAHLSSYKVDESHLRFVPYLECDDGEWLIKSALNEKIELFEQSGKQADRGQGLIIDRFLNCYQYDDYVVDEI